MILRSMPVRLGQGVLDWVELGAVGQEVEQARASGLDSSAGASALMVAEIVHYDDVVRPQFWNEHLIDVGLEGHAIDWPIPRHRCDRAAVAQRGNAGASLPVAMRDC